MSNDYPVSWEDIHIAAKTLSTLLKDKSPFKGIIAVTRGGLVPACQIAYELGIKTVDTISISSYEFQTQTELKVMKMPIDAGDGTGWLVIDELSDTGNTFRKIREIFPKAHFACLYAKPHGADVVDTYVHDVAQDSWIFLPWDDLTFPPHITDKIGKHLK